MNWPLKSLGELCHVITKGTTPTTLGLNFSANGIGFLRVQNIEDGKVNYDMDVLHIDERAHQVLSRSQIYSGDILISIAGTIGRSAIVPENAPPLNCNQAVSILRTNGGVFRPFLRRWLDSRDAQMQMRGAAVTGTISNISLSQIGNLKMPLPPLQEQRRIAAILDKAEDLRAKRRAAMAQFDSLSQSIFLELFGDPTTNSKGWPTKQLASLISEGDTINYGVIQPGDDLNEGIPLIRVGDLLEGRVTHQSLKRIAPSIEANYKRSRLSGDEILVSCVGSIGVVVLADQSVRGFNIARAVARIPLAKTISRTFIAAYLKTDFVQRYFTKELRTVSQPTLNIKQLAETIIAVPPAHLQAEFERRIAAVEKLKAEHCASLAEMNGLFASLQHRAFRGEL